MTIVDPRSGACADADVLGSPDDRLSGLPRRRRNALAAAAVVTAAAVWAGVALAEQRAHDRERAAAFALADRVHLQGALDALFSLEPGSGRLGAQVTIDAVDGEAGQDVVSSVRLEGPGIFSSGTPLTGRFTPPEQVLPEARVNCSRVGAGQIPDRATVVVTVVPASQVPHEQRLPADPAQVREAALAACDVPDPAAVPLVQASAQRGGLLLFVEAVRRSDADLRLEQVRIPGFEVTAAHGLRLPHRIGRDSGGFYGLPVRVTDCSAALAGDGQVTVVLSEDGRRVERTADPATAQPQVGAVPVEQLLAGLVAAAC